MKLSIGIVGLPNVGKSTLFKILTRQEVHIANYPFATIDPNVGVVPVPDPRMQRQRIILSGDVPNPAAVPSGCPFHPRCPERQESCTRVVPELKDLGGGHQAACLLR